MKYFLTVLAVLIAGCLSYESEEPEVVNAAWDTYESSAPPSYPGHPDSADAWEPSRCGFEVIYLPDIDKTVWIPFECDPLGEIFDDPIDPPPFEHYNESSTQTN